MLVIYRGRFALSASFYLHFIYLSKQHKCNAFPKQTKVEKGMDRYRALPLLTCEYKVKQVISTSISPLRQSLEAYILQLFKANPNTV